MYVQATELINLIFSSVFIVVLFRLLNSGKNTIPTLFLVGILFILLSNVFTVVEGFVFYSLFNLIEHLSFTLGTASIFFGSLKLLRENG